MINFAIVSNAVGDVNKNMLFCKIAKDLVNTYEVPEITNAAGQKNMIEMAKQEKLKGLSPVQHRAEVTRKSRGILERMRRTPRI